MPPVVKNLLIINGLFFLATIVLENTLGIDLVKYLGLYFFKSDQFHIYQIITHLFMHGGFFHLFSNMLALWMFGAAIENVIGSNRFLFYYLVTGLGAVLLHTAVIYFEVNSLDQAVNSYLLNPGIEQFDYLINHGIPEVYKPQFRSFYNDWYSNQTSSEFMQQSLSYAKEVLQAKMDVPTVGASGAVFGVLIAFGLMFPDVLIYIYFAIPIKAKYFILIYAGFELWQGIQSNPTDNVAHFAHLGGMIFGFLLMKRWGFVKRRYF